METARRGQEGRRVVVTGMGIVTTIGESLTEYRDALVAGRSGITRWKRMDERIDSKIGGDMSDFDLKAHLSRVGADYPPNLVQRAHNLLRATPLAGRMTAAAALQAYVDAGLSDHNLDLHRFGHVLAGHNLNLYYIYENNLTMVEEPDYIDPLYAMMLFDTDVLALISELLTLQGPAFSVGNACATGGLGVLAGLDLIRSGRADVVVVSGGCMDYDPGMLHGFAIVNAISTQSFNDEPARASRPFDAHREGFVPSEGAGALILETLTGARQRGARIHAEVLGAASTSDASRHIKPNLGGEVRAMRGALEDACIRPERVDYVNAHAASTPLGDAVEVAAIKATLGDRAYRIPVNSTKSMVGHCMNSSGIVELVATILQMGHGFVHATINQEEKDPELELDFVPNEARQHHIDIAISNSFGFGGLNTCVVVGRAP